MPLAIQNHPGRGQPTAAAIGRQAAAPGLVEQVTSQTRTTVFATNRLSEARAQVSRHRRIRRMRRCVIAHADTVRDLPGFRHQALLVTLTYRPDAGWDSKQVARYVDLTRKHLARRGVELRYQWVIELTRKGRPHYHLLFWVPHGTRIPKPDESGHWPHGLTRVEVARRPVGYLVKYATKGDGGELPRGARLFGCGGDRDARFQAHRKGLPAWLDEAATPGTRVRRVPFVGWLEADTGAIHASPFRFVWGRDPCGLVTLTMERINAIVDG